MKFSLCIGNDFRFSSNKRTDCKSETSRKLFVYKIFFLSLIFGTVGLPIYVFKISNRQINQIMKKLLLRAEKLGNNGQR